MEHLDTVLIVEDNETDRYVLKRRLARRWPEAQVLEATDGQAAIEILEAPGQRLPDLIFLDINMPGMDGYGFLEAYYGQQERDIPVVMMLTSSDREDDRQRAARFSCVKVFAKKPVKQEVIDELPQRLQQASAVGPGEPE